MISMRVFGRASPDKGSLMKMCIAAQARSAWPVSSLRPALKVIARPDPVRAFLIDRNADCRSIQPASNSTRPRAIVCCAFMTMRTLASSEYSILTTPRIRSRMSW